MIDWSQLKKAAEVQEEQATAAADLVKNQRMAAYRAEADHLKNEADFDAAVSGGAPDYTVWVAKVKEIKERFPFN